MRANELADLISGCAEERRVFCEGSIDVVEDFTRRI